MNLSDIVLEPLIAAGRRDWLRFWFINSLDLCCISLFAWGVVTRYHIAIAVASLAFVSLRFAFARFPGNKSVPRQTLSALLGLVIVLGTWMLVIERSVSVSPSSFGEVFPSSKTAISYALWMIEGTVDFISAVFGAALAGLADVISSGLLLFEIALLWAPWPVVLATCVGFSYAVGGKSTALFSLGALSYLGIFGFWREGMLTLSMVAASVSICVVIGVPLGIFAAKNVRISRFIEPVLDTMQTMPSFVYLIPAVTFFSIGKAPGVISTVIFALPPVVRLTALGLRQVPVQMREAALAFGATKTQLLVHVELPLSLPSIMTGINQAIMMSLSMVVVAALIGAGGLGTDVIRSLRNVETGNGILVGFAIVACAMMLDRVVRSRNF